MSDVRILSADGSVTSAEVFHDSGGRKLSGLKSVRVDIDSKRDKIVAEIELAGIDVMAEPRFVMINPVTGKLCEVESIKFVGQQEWTP